MTPASRSEHQPFTVPEAGHDYYVSTTGSNRNTGKLPAAPKASPLNVLRTYAIGSGDTINVDAGTYPLITPIVVSGSTDRGLGLHQGFTLRGPNDPGNTVLFTPAIPGDRPTALVELDNAQEVTLYNLTLAAAKVGLWVHGGSNEFRADYVTASDDTEDAIRIETTSPDVIYTHLTAHGAGGSGISVTGSIAGVTDSLAYENGEYGIFWTGRVMPWSRETRSTLTGPGLRSPACRPGRRC